MRKCIVCGVELPEGRKSQYCADCLEERNRRRSIEKYYKGAIRADDDKCEAHIMTYRQHIVEIKCEERAKIRAERDEKLAEGVNKWTLAINSKKKKKKKGVNVFDNFTKQYVKTGEVKSYGQWRVEQNGTLEQAKVSLPEWVERR